MKTYYRTYYEGAAKFKIILKKDGIFSNAQGGKMLSAVPVYLTLDLGIIYFIGIIYYIKILHSIVLIFLCAFTYKN